MLSKTSEALRKIRMEQGMYRTEFAELIGVSVFTYRTWEMGTREMSLSNIVKVCDALDIPYDELIIPRIHDIKHNT